MKVIEVKKSATFSQEKALAVVRFAPFGEGVSKFARASLADGETYSLTYDLKIAYGDDEQAKDEEGVFNANKAFKLFCKEMPIGHDEQGVHGYEFSISELTENAHDSVFIKASKRVAKTLRPACYGTREKARLLALNNLNTRISRKEFLWEAPQEKKEDDEE